MSLDLLVAGLIAPADAPVEMRALRLQALEKWLARADRVRNDARTASEWLGRTFSLPDPAAVAPVALAGEGQSAVGAWLRADPVHIRLDRDRTSLHAGTVLDISREEADALLAVLAHHFRGELLEFRAPSPERWYVRVAPADVPRTTALEEALGRDAQKLIPAASGSIKWPAALTEMQMLLASHEVNARREKEGRPAINSLWLWGGGEKPASLASPYTAVYADDPFARGLAAIAGARVANSPAVLDAMRPESGRILAMSDAPLRAVHRGNAAEWSAAAEGLERGWFDGIGDAIGRFGEVRLVLPASSGTLVASLTRAASWRVLRARRPLAAYA